MTSSHQLEVLQYKSLTCDVRSFAKKAKAICAGAIVVNVSKELETKVPAVFFSVLRQY